MIPSDPLMMYLEWRRMEFINERIRINTIFQDWFETGEWKR